MKASKRRYSIFALCSVVLFFISLIIFNVSDFFRGDNPLYTYLKMGSWILFFGSITWAIVNAILIAGRKDFSTSAKLAWIMVSLLPLLYLLAIALAM